MTIRIIKPSLHWSNPAVERVLYFGALNYRVGVGAL